MVNMPVFEEAQAFCQFHTTVLNYPETKVSKNHKERLSTH